MVLLSTIQGLPASVFSYPPYQGRTLRIAHRGQWLPVRNTLFSWTVFHLAAISIHHPTNNRIRWKFAVTDTTFSHNNGRIHGYFASTDNNRYEIGNCYFLPKGGNALATSVSFAFQNPLDLTGANLQVFLYKWKTVTTFADANGDTLANSNEYELVGFNAYTITGSEVNQLVTVSLSDGLAPGIPLEDSAFYFATVAYHEPLPGKLFFIAAGEEIDYSATVWLSYQQGFPRYLPMLRLGDDSHFSVKGFGLRRIPVARLNIQEVTPTKEITVPARQLIIFPNPTAERIWLRVPWQDAPADVFIEIFNIQGKKLWTKRVENAFVSQLPIEVNDLHNGWHILRVISGDKSATGSFFVVKN